MKLKIGAFTFPLYRLDKMLHATKKIYDLFKDEFAKADVASVLGHSSSKSGAVAQKIADLTAYGLVERTRDKFRISQIGRDATYGTPDEKNRAIQNAVQNIPLWARLLQDFGPNIEEKDFWIALRNITGAESPVAQNKANLVRNSYIEDVRLIKPVSEPEQLPQHESQWGMKANSRKRNMETPQIEPKMATISIESQYVQQSYLIPDAATYDDVIQILQALKPVLKLNEREDKDVRDNNNDGDTEKNGEIDNE